MTKLTQEQHKLLLTNLEPTRQTFCSQYGVVTYEKWCAMEVERINRARAGKVEMFYQNHNSDPWRNMCAIKLTGQEKTTP